MNKRIILALFFIFLGLLSVNAQQSFQEEFQEYDAYVRQLSCYRQTSDLSMKINEAFLKGDIALVRRLSAQREKFLLQSIDSVLAFRADALHSEAAARMVSQLTFNLGFENTEKVIARFDTTFNPLPLQEIRISLEAERKVRPGMPAPDFSAFDKSGKEYTLDSFPGKYIFLEFSASWCTWCKKEIPAIRKAYERFNEQVVFITIHLDTDKEKWLKDLQEYAVPWFCLTDLKAWESPMAKAYNISGVPDCFIIGPDRKIKAKSLRGHEIEDALAKLLEHQVGIQFYDGIFEEALMKAKQEDKLIFLDGYTSWCAPCKMMNTTVFTQPEIGRFFNEHFINVKFDMKQGEGRDLLKRYSVQVFPTYLLLDAEGNEIHRVVGGHDADEFIRLISDGMDSENSIAGMQKRYDDGERDVVFLRKYITSLGGGYRFDKIPEVMDEYCRQLNGKITETDWQLIWRFLSDPLSYAFQFVAENREQLHAYIASEELEEWIGKVLYAPVFNVVNEAVFDMNKHDGERIAGLREVIKTVKPLRADYLLAILDYYNAFYSGKMNKVLAIYKKQFMNLPGNDRFGLTMQLNAMLYAKGNKTQCEEGLRIFHKLFNPNDPVLKNFETSLHKRMDALEK